MSRTLLRGALALSAALTLAAGLATAPAAPPAAAAVGGLTWSDEFTGAAGTAPSSARWAYDVGGAGWGNNELEYYTTSTSNAALDGNGNLVITARQGNPSGYSCWYGSCQYTSARLKTQGKFTQAYGRFEARMKIPRGQGLWPAFWMLGDNIGSVGWPNSGEIDIMENVGFEPSTVHGTIHGPGYSGCCGLGGGYTLPGGQSFADAFHTFAVDWEPGAVTWYVDGIQYSRHTSAETNGNPWVFDHPFFLILNVAVGGNWPGSPNASTVFPQTMTIDYVRVYSWTSGGTRVGPITGYGSKCVDVASAGTANGTKIQLWTCNGTNAQQWTIGTDGTIRALGKCLDVASGGTADGTKVQLWDCNGTAAQKWTYTAGRDLVNPQSNKCLDAAGVSSADGTQLQIWTCGGGANQKWNLPA
ncbi:family 16 glycosylhydrolase [Hamadaea sp. NPDC051192]|uniref:ricin-type beta-trefoil lectin domain protein n=1 Tax=Hamadaea sp. NPDC051192 TaxID=3154940 RepID=UPI00343FB518